MTQENYVEKRTNRRNSTKKFKGKDRRKGLGRRKDERFSFCAYIIMLSILSSIVFAFLAFILFNYKG